VTPKNPADRGEQVYPCSKGEGRESHYHKNPSKQPIIETKVRPVSNADKQSTDQTMLPEFGGAVVADMRGGVLAPII
jgi:hypothetical protein